MKDASHVAGLAKLLTRQSLYPPPAACPQPRQMGSLSEGADRRALGASADGERWRSPGLRQLRRGA